MSNVVNKKASRTEYLATLRSKMQEMSSPKGFTPRQDDELFWKPEVDKAGTGSAVIRFLPAKKGEPFPFVQLHTHGFQGPTTKWFIENCPTSIGGNCPACKANTVLWNSGVEADKKVASSRKRKLNYISNILVVSDPKHPENNGQVRLFKYGKKIFDKIQDMISPPAEFADLEPIEPFDMEEGVNFKLRIVRVDNFPNYDKSTFDTTTTAIGDEDRIAEIASQLHSLEAILDTKKFKTYEELQTRLEKATGEEAPAETDSKPVRKDAVTEPEAAPARTQKVAEAPATKAAPAAKTAVADAPDDDDFFTNLAKQSD